MKNDMSIIIKNFLCFFLKCLLPVLVVGLIYFDIKTFGDIREKSLVELGQSVFLFAASVIFMYLANKKKANGLWLVAGFFVCMLIVMWGLLVTFDAIRLVEADILYENYNIVYDILCAFLLFPLY